MLTSQECDKSGGVTYRIFELVNAGTCKGYTGIKDHAGRMLHDKGTFLNLVVA